MSSCAMHIKFTLCAAIFSMREIYNLDSTEKYVEKRKKGTKREECSTQIFSGLQQQRQKLNFC